jgi:hypothetical protein
MQPEVPLFDPANPPQSKVPASLLVGKIPVPEGELGVVTIRLASGVTLPVLLDKAETGQWADSLAMLRDSLSGAGLVIPGKGDALRIAGSARNGQGL